MSVETKKTYLGDGVYASFDGFMIRLFTNNGLRDLNEIYLEDTVLEALFGFVRRIYGVNIEITKKEKESEEEHA